MIDIISDLGRLILRLMDNVLFVWVIISSFKLAINLSNGSFSVGIITVIVVTELMSLLETSPKEIETRRFSDDVVPCRTMLNASIILMMNRIFAV